jgi:hypothetical protein
MEINKPVRFNVIVPHTFGTKLRTYWRTLMSALLPKVDIRQRDRKPGRVEPAKRAEAKAMQAVGDHR